MIRLALVLFFFFSTLHVGAVELLTVPFQRMPRSVKRMQFNSGGASTLWGPGQTSAVGASLLPLHGESERNHSLSGAHINFDDGNKHLFVGAYSTDLFPDVALGIELSRLRSFSGPDTIDYNALYLGVSHLHSQGRDSYLYTGVTVSLHTVRDDLGIVAPHQNLSEDEKTDTYGEHLLTADISLMEFDLYNGANFALVLENIVGYRWLENTVQRSSASKKRHSVGKWTGSQLRSLLISGANNIAIPHTESRLIIPMDVRFWGPLNRDLRERSKMRNRIEFFTGAELVRDSRLGLVFGYAWKNETVTTDPIHDIPHLRPEHSISGGLSFYQSNISIHAALHDNHWGVELITGF
ncbi:hypothetical protein [Chitinivibrio alkaliphilus]|uniref:Uncharacterized protein n=1 Tax=Chitinivibrio alkaliphilus ACht1 TaxID=1313304 RepID=U7D8C8_9BACT|nr:hypothetical protein [Chitinivibrio alkaliphilus]ERP39215.1 hypothetical protein CALK_0385 [Chitinivibrio alkaliphilus ACht1]